MVILSSCFPYIFKSDVPTLPAISLLKELKQSNEDILVIPVWVKAPFNSYEGDGKTKTIFLGEAIILSANEIYEIPAKISKTSFGVVTPGTNTGRWVLFDEIFLISKSGYVLCLSATGTHPQSVTKWGSIKQAWMGAEWKNELIETFKASKDNPGSDLWGYKKIRIDYSSGKRLKVVEFLKETSINAITEKKNNWEIIPYKE